MTNNQHPWAERARAAAQRLQPPEEDLPTTADEPDAATFNDRPEATGPVPSRDRSAAIRVESGAAAGSANPLVLGQRDRAARARVGIPATDVDDDGDPGLETTGMDHVVGPSNPPVAPAPLNPALVLPEWWHGRAASAERPSAVTVQVVGLHGGAGTSTVAALLGDEAHDAEGGLAGLATMNRPILFVARTNGRGLDLALRAGQQYASRGFDPVPVLGIVLVHDAPTLSKGLARQLRSAQKALPNSWTVAWDENLRHDVALPTPATRGRLARDARRILKKAAQLIPPDSIHSRSHTV